MKRVNQGMVEISGKAWYREGIRARLEPRLVKWAFQSSQNTPYCAPPVGHLARGPAFYDHLFLPDTTPYQLPCHHLHTNLFFSP